MDVRAWTGEILVRGAKELPWKGYRGQRHKLVRISIVRVEMYVENSFAVEI